MTEHDHQLLGEFAKAGSEPAFATLVSRYVNLVYSTALRSVGNAQNAEDITQAVFIILARKAGTLSPRVVLSGWLYQTTRLTAANFMRREFGRHRHEEEAAMQSSLNKPADAAWLEIAPLLDEVMERLGPTDRDAVLLRYFENKTAAEIGEVLRMSEDSARRRVNRALVKLRRLFLKRGVTSMTSTIAGAISANAVLVAPVALAKTATAVAVAKGATVSGSTLALAKGALKIMAWTKAQTAIVIGVAAVLVAGTVTTLEVHRQHARTQTEFPRSSWAAVGYTDPVSAFETGLWGAVQGDGKALMASFSPKAQEETTVKVGRQMQAQGKSLGPEELFAQLGSRYVDGVTGFRILDKTTSGNQVILHLQFEGRERKETVTMKKIGEEWRIDYIQ